jgi:hypothetical protein
MAAEALTHRLDPCPDAETLAAYLDGRLTLGEREDVTAHVADCEACYFVVTEIAQTAAAMPVGVEPDVEPARPWWKSKRAVWSASAAAAVATAARCGWWSIRLGFELPGLSRSCSGSLRPRERNAWSKRV